MLSEDSQENSAVVSLMSTDVDRISQAFELLNECWSRIIELCIGIPLLAFQLGWVSVMPLIVVLGKERMGNMSKRFEVNEF